MVKVNGGKSQTINLSTYRQVCEYAISSKGSIGETRKMVMENFIGRVGMFIRAVTLMM